MKTAQSVMQSNIAKENFDGIKDFLESITGDPAKQRIEETLGDGYVRLHVSEAEKRQARHDIQWMEDIVIELLRNSKDADAENIFLATKKDINGMRQLTVVDDGKGIPEKLHHKILEPRVTSKLNTLIFDDYGIHGRGMALYSVKYNTEDSKITWSEPGKGTAFYCLADTKKLKERKDQSTFPTIKVDEGIRRVVAGPRNIIRTATEFALYYPKIKLFVGSPAETVSTMYHMSLSEEFRQSPWSNLAVFTNHAKFLKHVNDRYGIRLSERNAYRILQGDIPPILPIVIRKKRLKPSLAVSGKKHDTTIKLGFDNFDLAEISKQIEKIIRPYSKKYALEIIDKPDIYINNNQLNFKIFFTRSSL